MIIRVVTVSFYKEGFFRVVIESVYNECGNEWFIRVTRFVI